MPTSYKTILVAVDLNAANDELLLRKALSLAKLEQAAVYLVHAIEPIDAYGTTSAFYALADVEATIAAEHTEAIRALAKE
ncbi:MAG: universal stress protein, partial [Neisseriaceae bacterium]|nr:universal stress protein [Neisseriaceae bacterium]